MNSDRRHIRLIDRKKVKLLWNRVVYRLCVWASAIKCLGSLGSEQPCETLSLWNSFPVFLDGRRIIWLHISYFITVANNAIRGQMVFVVLGNVLNQLQLHADLSVYFRSGHNRWILYPEGSIYSSGLSLRECSFWLGSKKVRFYGGRLRSEFKGIEQWLN